MSDAADRLARSRLAIIEQVHGRERHAGKRDGDGDGEYGGASRSRPFASGPRGAGAGGGWFSGVKRALGTWWRHHPAHMGVELATPMLSSYARRKPLQYLGIAAAVGAALMVVRPWRLISATGLLVAVLKSSQLSGMLMSALSAAGDGDDEAPPYG